MPGSPIPADGQSAAGIRYTVRGAVLADLESISRINEECFPVDDIDRGGAAAAELETGIRVGSIWLTQLRDSGEIVGFLYVQRPTEDHMHIHTTAVATGHRNLGNAARLVRHVLAEHPGSPPESVAITATVGPRNFPMLRILCQAGFVGRVVFRDFFGPGKDRVYCQLKRHTEFIDPDDRYVLPATTGRQIDDLLRRDSYVLTNLYLVDGQDYLEISRYEEVDVPALQAYESNTSVQFSSTLLAALTFLLNVAFSGTYPDSVRIMLVQATALTLGSTVIYANASGLLARMGSAADAARTRASDFELYMKWGNLLSEYGGVLPMFLVLPVVFAHASSNRAAALAMGGLLSLLAAGYERSPYALTHRYRRTVFTTIVVWVTIALPFLGSLAEHGSWIWAVAASIMVYARILINASTSVHETVHTINSSGPTHDLYHRGVRGMFFRRGPVPGLGRTRHTRPTPGGT